MKITSISTIKEYIKKELEQETITIILTNKESNIQSKALYYLICAIKKMENNDYKDLDLITKMQVDTRINVAIEFLEQLKEQVK